ncbi:coatomer subunit gamma [Pholiota molesta]|nr:coatomer subunit gamma [Pholiota molesta]
MASFAMVFPSKKEDESGLSSYYNNKTTIIQEARCRALLTRIVYLLYVGETFGTQEATTLFFGTTKLFQHKMCSALRQAVYLAIKELATTAEDVIMVTSSIMKDMQPNSEVIYRPMQFEHCAKSSMCERFFKAAIVDRNPSIASAALVSAYHLFPAAKDVVKRWVNEVQEPYIAQYHALGLLYLIRQQDRMAITKMIQQLGGGKSGAGTTLKNPMALCMLIRYAAKVMEEDPNVQRQILELLEGWLPARAICEMKNVSPAQLTKPIAVLQTGNEASVDRLIKQITGFMSEISDEFKVIIHASMLTFLSSVLRDEGGYDFKRAVVEAMFDMINLSLNRKNRPSPIWPTFSQPAKYIRFIYNRVVLENATVRAAAVTSLAKFGVNSAEPTLKKSITVLLNRCLDDVDDEVRDRAALYLKFEMVAYVKDPAAAEQPFDVSAVPKISRAQAAAEAALYVRAEHARHIGRRSKKAADAPAAPSAAEKQSEYAQQLSEFPSSPIRATPAQLTESETEYQVNCVKHIFKEHIVFQFNISNTIPDTVLEQVSVIMAPQSEDTGLVEDFIINLPSLSARPRLASSTCPSHAKPELYAIASFQCTLKFTSKELDPSTGVPEEEGYEDEYQVEEVELSAGGDYIVPSYASFSTEWDRLRSAPNATETFASACDSIIESTSVHTLQLSVLVRCRMTFSRGQGVTLELGVRAEKQEVCDLVLAAVGG